MGLHKSDEHDKKHGPSAETREAAEKLGHDIGQLKDDLVEIGHDAAATAQAGLADAQESVQRAVDAAKAKGADTIESLKDYIEEHPLASAGIALGVGVLIGMAFSRRS